MKGTVVEPRKRPPLNVGVLVDLELTPSAGGHVKIWQRLAEAAAVHAGELELTVHFSGDADHVRQVAPNVQQRVHRPVFSTAKLPFLSYVPAHTDLAPFHRRLSQHLHAHDVLHTTDGCFAFARTAAAVAQRRGVPLVNSMHTDNAGYTAVFTEGVIQSLLGRGVMANVLRERLRVSERAAEVIRRRVIQHQLGCAFVLASKPADAEALASRLTPDRVGVLRRGMDHERFHPRLGDRGWLAREARIPAGVVTVLLVGRLDASKNVRVLVDAIRRLGDEQLPVHLVTAGEGPERAYVEATLGRRASCLGPVDSSRLPRVYASCDSFALPSVLDETSNATLEALTSGLPVVVSAHSQRLVRDQQTGLVVRSNDATAWAAALRALVTDPAKRLALGTAARAHAEAQIPSWEGVLAEDLLPVWKRAAQPFTPALGGRG